jgi:hypothetical protein
MLFGFESVRREEAGSREPGIMRGDLEILAHPVRYLRWRVDVRQNGPYAKAYDGGRPTPRLTPLVSLAFLLLVVAAIVAILVTQSN